MKIKTISCICNGYVNCKSCFYSSSDALSDDVKYDFSMGANELIGDVDSGVWAISYLLSMYKYAPKDFILFGEPKVAVNNMGMSLSELSSYSCYLDMIYPLFSTRLPIKKLVYKGLQHSKSKLSPDEIKDIFHLDSQRFERSISSVGNEIFNVMAAISYSYDKQIFCFPWLSERRFNRYETRILDLLDILARQEKTVILPMGKS